MAIDTTYNPQGGINVDPSAIKQYVQSGHDPMGGVTFSGFDKALGTASDVLGAVGPAADQLLGGHVTARAIANSTISSVYGGGTPGLAGGGGPGMYGPPGGKFLGSGSMPGTAPGYPGSSGMPGGAPGFPGGGSPAGGMNPMGTQDISQYDNQINSMMNNNLMFLAIQTKVQNVSQVTQLMSNIAKADSDAKLNAVRNVRS
jgi:hypothetical protein